MKKNIGRVLGPLVFLALVFAPISESVMPTSARYVAAVTLLMIIWWITEAIPLEATALLPVVLFPALGVLSAKPTKSCSARPIRKAAAGP